MPPKIRPAIDRFFEKVKKTNSCWIWTGAIGNNGRGRFGLGKRGSGIAQSHRFSYEFHNGNIPDGIFVCHHCDNPICVRPDHLFLGTHQDNMNDMIKKGRNSSVIGTNHWKNKFSCVDIKSIRNNYRRGIFGYRKLAKKYGSPVSTIQSIINRKNWKHLP